MLNKTELENIDDLRVLDDNIRRIRHYLITVRESAWKAIRSDFIAILDDHGFADSDVPRSHVMYEPLRVTRRIYSTFPFDDHGINHVYIDGRKMTFGELLDELWSL